MGEAAARTTPQAGIHSFPPSLSKEVWTRGGRHTLVSNVSAACCLLSDLGPVT